MSPKKPVAKKADSAFLKPISVKAAASKKAASGSAVAKKPMTSRIVMQPVGKPRHLSVAAIRSAVRRAVSAK